MALYRRMAMAAMAAVLLVLAGCSAERSEPRYLHPPAAARCPAVDESQTVAVTEPLEPGFRPVSAAICQFVVVVRSEGGDIGGGWQWTTVQRSDGPFEELISALRTPPPTVRGKICPAMAQSPMYIALLDSSGRAVVPAIPADPCGFRLRSVDEAVRHLDWVTVESRS